MKRARIVVHIAVSPCAPIGFAAPSIFQRTRLTDCCIKSGLIFNGESGVGTRLLAVVREALEKGALHRMSHAKMYTLDIGSKNTARENMALYPIYI